MGKSDVIGKELMRDNTILQMHLMPVYLEERLLSIRKILMMLIRLKLNWKIQRWDLMNSGQSTEMY